MTLIDESLRRHCRPSVATSKPAATLTRRRPPTACRSCSASPPLLLPCYRQGWPSAEACVDADRVTLAADSRSPPKQIRTGRFPGSPSSPRRGARPPAAAMRSCLFRLARMGTKEEASAVCKRTTQQEERGRAQTPRNPALAWRAHAPQSLLLHPTHHDARITQEKGPCRGWG